MSIQEETADDLAAFEDVVREAGPAMLAYARRRVDEDTAEDVVAEALLVLWRRRHEATGRSRDQEVAWAVGITKGCLANAQRAARRHLSLVARMSSLASSERPPPAPGASSSGDDEALHAALGALREEDRELLRLWAWDDLKPAQIATVLGTTSDVVSVRLHRAKKRLAALLTVGSEASTSTR